jgi:hypothetical protein
VTHLDDEDPGVRTVAADQLMILADAAAFRALRVAYDRERDPEVRRAMASALVAIDPGFDDQGEAGAMGVHLRAAQRWRAAAEALAELQRATPERSAPDR